MARKGIRLELPKPIKGKLYKNSECQGINCMDFLSIVKLKTVDTDRQLILCRKCYESKNY